MLTFGCDSCQNKFLIFDGEPRPTCCGQACNHLPAQPSATVREVVDTGLMARRLEVVAGVVSLQQDRDSPSTIK